MSDHKLSKIKNFPQHLVKKLVDNFSINSAEGFIAMYAVSDRNWLSKQLDITNNEISEAIDIAKSVLTEDEIKLYSKGPDSREELG